MSNTSQGNQIWESWSSSPGRYGQPGFAPAHNTDHPTTHGVTHMPAPLLPHKTLFGCDADRDTYLGSEALSGQSDPIPAPPDDLNESSGEEEPDCSDPDQGSIDLTGEESRPLNDPSEDSMQHGLDHFGKVKERLDHKSQLILALSKAEGVGTRLGTERVHTAIARFRMRMGRAQRQAALITENEAKDRPKYANIIKHISMIKSTLRRSRKRVLERNHNISQSESGADQSMNELWSSLDAVMSLLSPYASADTIADDQVSPVKVSRKPSGFACVSCRKSKVKCLGGIPCERCMYGKRECVLNVIRIPTDSESRRRGNAVSSLPPESSTASPSVPVSLIPVAFNHAELRADTTGCSDVPNLLSRNHVITDPNRLPPDPIRMLQYPNHGFAATDIRPHQSWPSAPLSAGGNQTMAPMNHGAPTSQPSSQPVLFRFPHPEAVEERVNPCERCTQGGYLCYVAPGRNRKLRCLTCTTGECSFMPKANTPAQPSGEGPGLGSRQREVPPDPPVSNNLVSRESVIALIRSQNELARAASLSREQPEVWKILHARALSEIKDTGFSWDDLGITAFSEIPEDVSRVTRALRQASGRCTTSRGRRGRRGIDEGLED